MPVATSLDWLLEDEVAICMVGNHNILVAGPSTHQETASVIGVEFAERGDLDKDLKVGQVVADPAWSWLISRPGVVGQGGPKWSRWHKDSTELHLNR